MVNGPWVGAPWCMAEGLSGSKHTALRGPRVIIRIKLEKVGGRLGEDLNPPDCKQAPAAAALDTWPEELTKPWRQRPREVWRRASGGRGALGNP